MLFIRLFQPKDVEWIMKLVNDEFNRNYNQIFYLDLFRSWRNGFLIAESNGKVVGFLLGVISEAFKARILLMAVEPMQRGKGIGAALIDVFIKNCIQANLRAISLEVRIGNERAIRFYNRYGFENIAVFPSYYEDGEAGYIMQKNL